MSEVQPEHPDKGRRVEEDQEGRPDDPPVKLCHRPVSEVPEGEKERPRDGKDAPRRLIGDQGVGCERAGGGDGKIPDETIAPRQDEQEDGGQSEQCKPLVLREKFEPVIPWLFVPASPLPCRWPSILRRFARARVVKASREVLRCRRKQSARRKQERHWRSDPAAGATEPVRSARERMARTTPALGATEKRAAAQRNG